jgi:hypothetical protein
MEQMYDTPEDLLRESEAGEDSFLDFKEVGYEGRQLRLLCGGRSVQGRASAEVAKDLCCFANSEGGVLVFGVRDDGERIGVEADRMDELQQFLVNVGQNNVEPPLGHLLFFDRMRLPDRSDERRLCLKLEVKKALYNVHAPRGRRPYWRIADQCHEMTLEHQARAFERRGLMSPFEERPVFNAPPEALEAATFAAYYEQRYGHPLTEPTSPGSGCSRTCASRRLTRARPCIPRFSVFCSSPPSPTDSSPARTSTSPSTTRWSPMPIGRSMPRSSAAP